MTQHINKDAVVAEIESLQAKTSIGLNEYTAGYENGKAEVCRLLLSFINSMPKDEEQTDRTKKAITMKVKFAKKIYQVLETKELPGGKVMIGIEDEPGHLDFLNLEDVEVVNSQPEEEVSEDLEKLRRTDNEN